MEDKQKILDLLLPALQATRGLHDLIELKYDSSNELVEAVFSSGGRRYVNGTLDSGIAMIKDVISRIM